jgi:hypothetical protein
VGSLAPRLISAAPRRLSATRIMILPVTVATNLRRRDQQYLANPIAKDLRFCVRKVPSAGSPGTTVDETGRSTMPKESKSGHLSRRSFAVAGTAAIIGSMGGFRSVLAASDIRTINFRVVGTDEPTLILVHGFACTLEDWDAQVRGLSPRFRCAALDLPGHGVQLCLQRSPSQRWRRPSIP